jgi:hypothetical protein
VRPSEPSRYRPESSWCQRWAGGRHSWRHLSEGGFDAAAYEVVPIDEAVARRFVTQHHYAGSYPAARQAYGLVTRDEHVAGGRPDLVDGLPLVGVAVLSVPMRAAVLTNVFPALEPYVESLELGRFVLADQVPANGESWMLARVWRHAAATGVRGVVSFSDPMPRHVDVEISQPDGTTLRRREVRSPGHIGAIYQATNAVACGRSTARTLNYLPTRGMVLSERTLSKVRTGDRGAAAAEQTLVELGARCRRPGQCRREWLRQALSDLEARKIRHPGNFRYAWQLGDRRARRQVRIAAARTPYPKADRDLLPAVVSSPSEEGVLW